MGACRSASTSDDDSGDVRLVTALYTDAAQPGHGRRSSSTAVPTGPTASTTSPRRGARIDFLTQAVDGGGNVAVSSNKGAYFESTPIGPPTITVTGQQEPGGWFTGPVEVTVTPFLADGSPVDVTVNGAPASGAGHADRRRRLRHRRPPGERARGTGDGADRHQCADAQATTTPDFAAPRSGPVAVGLQAPDTGIGVASITYTTTTAAASRPR